MRRWAGLENLGNVLEGHAAGEELSFTSSDLYHRNTDELIKVKVGKQFLYIRVDRIVSANYFE
jgi:transcriptional antiterminator Rof (Rho-off)